MRYGLVIVTGVATIQVKLTVPVLPEASLTVTLAVGVATVFGVPVIAPVVALIDNPAARPVADQVYGVVPPLAVKVFDTATPIVVACAPGLVAVGAAAVVQVNETDPVRFRLASRRAVREQPDRS
jgi:hypothetical protein